MVMLNAIIRYIFYIIQNMRFGKLKMKKYRTIKYIKKKNQQIE